MTIRRSFNCTCFLFLASLPGTAPHLAAQQPSPTTAAAAPLPVYDAVSIRENKSATDNMSVRWGGDAYVANNITLTSLVMGAYNIRAELISGLPGWASSVHFDINAKISDPDPNALKKLSGEQRRAMMVALLTDRFRLRAHSEVKILAVYDLVIAKDGLKIKEDTTPIATQMEPPNGPRGLKPGNFMISNSEMVGVAMPISLLAPNLASIVERNIVDKTGLTGKYDIDLKWTPSELENKANGLTDHPPPDLFTALQEQLGLKLEPSKGPVQTLVIDHIEMPTAN